MGPSPCVHRTSPLQQPLPKQTYTVTKPGSAHLERRVRCTPEAQPQPPSSAGRNRVHALPSGRAPPRLPQRRGPRLPTLFQEPYRVPAPQASRPAQPRAHSGRSGPARAPRKWTSGPEEQGPRPAAIQARPPGSPTRGCTVPRPRGPAPDLPAQPALSYKHSSAACPGRPSRSCQVKGKASSSSVPGGQRLPQLLMPWRPQEPGTTAWVLSQQVSLSQLTSLCRWSDSEEVARNCSTTPEVFWSFFLSMESRQMQLNYTGVFCHPRLPRAT
eukprot:XP_006239180.1 PREDICTED: acidic proline-rich protein PRP25-like [Rattus norvegicus]